MPLHLRIADEADIPAIARVGVRAFAQDAMNQALFPPHLRPADDPELDERLEFRMTRTRERMNKKGAYSLVVTDDTLPLPDQIVGYAQWDAPRPQGDPTPEEKEAARREKELSQARYPKTFDRAAFDRLYADFHAEEVRVFGEKGARDAWYCVVLCTDPSHERRGIGRLLTQWGVDKAASEGKDCYLIATPMGEGLYRKLGFECVGKFELFGAPQSSMLIRGSV